eukprot:1155124-Pelagomonas_calceolata.AAC.8
MDDGRQISQGSKTRMKARFNRSGVLRVGLTQEMRPWRWRGSNLYLATPQGYKSLACHHEAPVCTQCFTPLSAMPDHASNKTSLARPGSGCAISVVGLQSRCTQMNRQLGGQKRAQELRRANRMAHLVAVRSMTAPACRRAIRASSSLTSTCMSAQEHSSLCQMQTAACMWSSASEEPAVLNIKKALFVCPS